jgi:hypothetical protein
MGAVEQLVLTRVLYLKSAIRDRKSEIAPSP